MNDVNIILRKGINHIVLGTVVGMCLHLWLPVDALVALTVVASLVLLFCGIARHLTPMKWFATLTIACGNALTLFAADVAPGTVMPMSALIATCMVAGMLVTAIKWQTEEDADMAYAYARSGS